MATRKRRNKETPEFPEESAVTKRPKLSEDACERFLTLSAEPDSLVAALTFFLGEVKRGGSGGGASLLLGSYMSKHPDCEELLTPFQWERDKQTQDVLLLCFQCLEQVLLFTASSGRLKEDAGSDVHHFQPLGVKLVRTLLKEHLHPVYSSLVTTVPMRLVAACLRMLTAMVVQGSTSAREVQAVFNFAYKPLGILPNRTNIIQGTLDSVRLCLMNFALSFLVVGENETIKSILELKGFLSSLFKLLPKDSPATIRRLLSTIQDKVVLNKAINKRTKSAFFTHFVFKQLSQLLHPQWQPSGQQDSATATPELRRFVFDFLLKLCTDFQLGVCYKTKELPGGLEKTNNPVLLQLLLPLVGSLGDHLVKKLTLQTIVACPDLLLPYLKAISLTFDPQPGSKWTVTMKFLTKLLTRLPDPASLLASSGSQAPPPPPPPQPPLSLLELGVWFTVPPVVTRNMLTLGIQHPLPDVKHLTILLMENVLLRAASMVNVWGTVIRSLATMNSYLVAYCDRILKQLPDIRTLISVRQQLLTNPPEASKDPPATPLLALVISVMDLYQTLSPAIIVHSDFNLAKLLPSVDDHGNIKGSCDLPVLQASLRVLSHAPPCSLKWQQQGGKSLHTLLWLASMENEDISKTASDLIRKLLEGSQALRGFECELHLMLESFAKFCATSPEDRGHLVSFVAAALLAVDKDWLEYGSQVESIVTTGGGGRGPDTALTLEAILAAPLEMPTLASVGSAEASSSTSGESDKTPFHICPLVPCLLSKLVEPETGFLIVFVGDVLPKWLLVEGTSQAVEGFARVALHYLTSESVREMYQSGTFARLYCGLVNYFCSWVPEHSAEVVEMQDHRKSKELLALPDSPRRTCWQRRRLGAVDISSLAKLAIRYKSTDLVREAFQHSLWDYARKPAASSSSSDVGQVDELDRLVRGLLAPTDHWENVGPARLPVLPAASDPPPPTDPVLCAMLRQLACKLMTMENSKRGNLSRLRGECGDLPGSPTEEQPLAMLDDYCTLSPGLGTQLLEFCFESQCADCMKLAEPLITKTSFGFFWFEQKLLVPYCEHIASTCDADLLRLIINFMEVAKDHSRDFRGTLKRTCAVLWEWCVCMLSEDKEPSSELCASLLKLFITHSKKCRRRALKVTEEWEGELWTRHQLSLCGAVAGQVEDTGLAGLALRKALEKLMHLSVCGAIGFEEGELIAKEACSVIKGAPQMSLEIDSELWNNCIHCLLRLPSPNASCLRLLSELVPLLYPLRTPATEDSVAIVTLDTLYEQLWSLASKLLQEFETTTHTEAKESLVELLVAIVELEPSVGSTEHVAVLLAAYSATRSNFDRAILYLLYKYEENGVNVGEFKPFVWGPAALEQYRAKQEVGWLLWKQPGTVDVIDQIDRKMMRTSSEEFPVETPLEPASPYCTVAEEGAELVYDHCFMLPLLSHLLDTSCVVDCRQFIDAGCLGYLISSLGSKEEGVRRSGSHALSRFWVQLEGARFKEKPLIVLLLQVLRNSLEENIRLSSLFAIFFAKAAELFLTPDQPLYPIIAHFIVHKPAVSLSHIPLFYTLLHSSSAQHAQECRWLVKLLDKGLKCKEDCCLYRKDKVSCHAVVFYNCFVMQ